MRFAGAARDITGGAQLDLGVVRLVVVRPFARGDEERMREIGPKAFMTLGLARLAIDKALPRDRVEEAYRREVEGYVSRALRGDESIKILVAEEAGRVVGYIVLGVDEGRSRLFGFKWGSIVSLAIDPEWWGRGVGTSLVREGLKWLKSAGVEYVEVFTDQNNVAAIRVYEKCGFRVTYSGILLSQRLDD